MGILDGNSCMSVNLHEGSRGEQSAVLFGGGERTMLPLLYHDVIEAMRRLRQVSLLVDSQGLYFFSGLVNLPAGYRDDNNDS